MSKTVEEKNTISAQISTLAYETLKWAKDMNCFKNEKGEIEGYFIIQRRPHQRTSKPVWTEHFGEEPHAWRAVLARMIELGMPICDRTHQGHYIGDPGEQGKKIGVTLNHAITRMESAKKMALDSMDNRQWDVVAPNMKQAIKSEFKDISPLQILEGVTAPHS